MVYVVSYAVVISYYEIRAPGNIIWVTWNLVWYACDAVFSSIYRVIAALELIYVSSYQVSLAYYLINSSFHLVRFTLDNIAIARHYHILLAFYSIVCPRNHSFFPSYVIIDPINFIHAPLDNIQRSWNNRLISHNQILPALYLIQTTYHDIFITTYSVIISLTIIVISFDFI